ncbi:MAG TPA: rhomboid family intramembrane serine protease [Fodinibius sp.]|nr:rhomboid family intramembrane serine protease [Fodinibius sp.]
MNYNNRYSPRKQFSVFPPAVKNLLIINGIVFLALNTPVVGQLLFEYGALWPVGSGRFEIWQPASYLFLHAGLAHIFFNMFALWMFGQAIENYWGTRRFTIYYFVTGIGAALIQLLVVSGSTPTVGASGAVYGILLAFGMMFPDRYIMLLIPPIPIKAKYFVAIFGVIELVSGLSRTSSNVANFAHLGGMLFGYILIKYWGLKGEEY